MKDSSKKRQYGVWMANRRVRHRINQQLKSLNDLEDFAVEIVSGGRTD